MMGDGQMGWGSQLTPPQLLLLLLLPTKTDHYQHSKYPYAIKPVPPAPSPIQPIHNPTLEKIDTAALWPITMRLAMYDGKQPLNGL